MEKINRNHIKNILLVGLIALVVIIDKFVYRFPRNDNLILNIIVMIIGLGFLGMIFLKDLKTRR